MKWFLLALMCCIVLVWYSENNKIRQNRLEAEYKAKVAEAEKFMTVLPELPPATMTDLPQDVVDRLHRSVNSSNVDESFKAIEMLWKNQDPVVIPVVRKALYASHYECWSNCANIDAMKERIMSMIANDVCQLNFEFLKILIKDKNKNLRLRAVQALSGYYTEDAMEVMSKSMNDTDSAVRTAAIDGVMSIKNGINKLRQEKIDALTREYNDKKRVGLRITPQDILKASD